MSAQSQKQFLKWMEKNDPALFSLVLKRQKIKEGQTNLHGMGAINWGAITGGIGSFFNTAVETVKNVLPQVVQYKAQNKILNTQLKRAESGLPPLTVADYAPVMTINPQIDPAAEAALTRVAIQTTTSGIDNLKPILLGGLGLGALFLFMSMRKKRR